MNGLPVAVVSTKRLVEEKVPSELFEKVARADWQFNVNGVFDNTEKAWKRIELLYNMFIRDAEKLNWTINHVQILDAHTLVDEVYIDYTNDLGEHCFTILGIDRTRVV